MVRDLLGDYEMSQKEYNELTKEVLNVILQEGLMDLVMDKLDIDEDYFETLLGFEGD